MVNSEYNVVLSPVESGPREAARDFGTDHAGAVAPPVLEADDVIEPLQRDVLAARAQPDGVVDGSHVVREAARPVVPRSVRLRLVHIRCTYCA